MTATMMAWTGAYAADPDDAEYQAALAAIEDDAVYLIKTDVSGTTYYVTTAGTLTSVKDEAGAFIITKTAGGAFGTGFRIDGNGTRFTNAPKSGDYAVLDVANYSTTTGDRADWERQILFLKDGKYAIRSCNTEYAESGWGDTGRTFWTYTVGEAVTPCYSYTPAYVWEFDKDVTLNQQYYKSKTVKSWPIFIQGAAGLVKDAGKYSSNAVEPTEGSLAALLDDTYTTFFHSAWSVSIEDAHYLQAELTEATQKIQFYFKKRSQNNNNRPTTIVVSASNDGTNFTEVKTLDSGFPTGDRKSVV